MKTEYVYGMRNRGFSLGCQPMDGFVRREDCVGGYHDLLVYNRKLTEEEVRNYELDLVRETLYHTYKTIPIKDVKAGEIFSCGKFDVVKLDNAYGGCLCLAKNVMFKERFMDDNIWASRWDKSTLRNKLQSLADGIKEKLIPFDRCFTDDSFAEELHCVDLISMLNLDEYRKYKDTIPTCGESYWTITARCATVAFENLYTIEDWGAVGIEVGVVYHLGAKYGVRPLIVLKSDTLVTVEEE